MESSPFTRPAHGENSVERRPWWLGTVLVLKASLTYDACRCRTSVRGKDKCALDKNDGKKGSTRTTTISGLVQLQASVDQSTSLESRHTLVCLDCRTRKV